MKDRVIHSYDPINDQENAEIHLEMQQDESAMPEEIFNEQIPSQLAANSQSAENPGPSAITMHHQPTEISDDGLRESVRSLNNMQRKAYDKVLSWSRNKMKNLNSLSSRKVLIQFIYL